MNDIIILFSDWSDKSLFLGLIVFASVILILELVFLLILNKKKNKKIPFELIKIIRIFSRFELTYIFIKIVEVDEGSSYPWNIIYNAPALLILLAGIIIPAYRILNMGIVYFSGEDQESALKKNLMIISGKSIKVTLLLLTFSLLLWNILALFPVEIQDSFTIRSILFVNGILISATIFLVVRGSFKSAMILIEQRKSTLRLAVLVQSLSIPIQLIIAALTLFWIKKMVSEFPMIYTLTDKSIYFLLLAAILVFLFKLIESVGSRLSRLSEENTNSLDKTLIEMIRMILRITVLTAGLFGVIRIVTGKPLTTLLAGLGIGGLALALAAQDTLKNFFGSLMIMTDKPFKIGERVLVKDYDGVIEAIGFRSTRIRTLTGHQVVIPNDQMASDSIENIGKRQHIRRLTNITVTYGTSPEKMEKALSIVKKILDNHEGMPPDLPPRVFFNDFNPDSLNIMMIYWYAPPDYWNFMTFSEKVNFEIMKQFNKEGIEFAFPTVTTYLEQPEGSRFRFEVEKD
jgi:MscS family membrane protein